MGSIQSYESRQVSAMKIVFFVLASVLALCLSKPEVEVAKPLPAVQDEDDRVLTAGACAAAIGTFVAGKFTLAQVDKVLNRAVFVINRSSAHLMVTAMDPNLGCMRGKQVPICVGDKALVYKTKLNPLKHNVNLSFPNDPRQGQVWGAVDQHCYVWDGQILRECSADEANLPFNPRGSLAECPPIKSGWFFSKK